MQEAQASGHLSHGDVVRRLGRASRHLRKAIRMIEDGQPCADVAQQVQAVEAGLRGTKQVHIRDHIDHCMDGHVKDGSAAAAVLARFKQTTRYL